MNIKERADNILETFGRHTEYWDCHNDEPLTENHRLIAGLLHVDGIISELEDEIITVCYDHDVPTYKNRVMYWVSVKEEMEKLCNYDEEE